MHSHSFQDTELKLHRYVNDSPRQIMEGLTILPYPVGLRNERLIIHEKRKFDMDSYSFQDIQLKLYRYGNDYAEQVAKCLTIPRCLVGFRNKGLIDIKN